MRLLLAILAFWSVSARPLCAEAALSEEQLGARYPYDLGPADIDVSSYPEPERSFYGVFKKACSRCHTPARPLYSPVVKRADWERYTRRMHLRSRGKAGSSFSKAEARAIVDFLSYDALLRKVRGKARFEEESRRLAALFEEVRRERSRRQVRDDRAKARRAPPYTGAP